MLRYCVSNSLLYSDLLLSRKYLARLSDNESIFSLKRLPFFFPQTFRAEIDIYIEIWNRSAKHVTIFTIDGSPVCINFNELLLLLSGLAFPETALNLLDVENATEDKEAEGYYA